MENASIDGYFTLAAFHAGNPVPGYCLTVSGENAAARNCIGEKGGGSTSAYQFFLSFLSLFYPFRSFSIVTRLRGWGQVFLFFRSLLLVGFLADVSLFRALLNRGILGEEMNDDEIKFVSRSKRTNHHSTVTQTSS